jgi:hypothetical protein
VDNLVVLHTGHALDLLGVLLGLLRLLWLLRDQFLQMLDCMPQLYCLSLTHLDLLIPLVQLSLMVVDIALSSDQLILSVLQSGAGIVNKVQLDVANVVAPHQLVVQLLDPCL